MSKKKFYAVRIGRKPGVYESWSECSVQTAGVSGASYKGFTTKEEAEAWLKVGADAEDVGGQATAPQVTNDFVEELKSSLGEGEVIAFTDGSYSDELKRNGYGAILIIPGEEEQLLYKKFDAKFDPDFVKERNASAELAGAMDAISQAMDLKKTKIYLFYDYDGIGKFGKEWSAKSKISKNM